MKKIVKVSAWLLILFILAAIYLSYEIYSFGWDSKPQKADTIIVLGCNVKGTVPTPFLKARLEEGLRLYKQGFAATIIVSGGKGTGEDITEAEAMRTYLVARGMSEKDIIMENEAKSTFENLKYSKVIMDKDGYGSAIIVSNKYHLKRASIMAKGLGIKAAFSGSYSPEYKSYEIAGFIREIPAIIKFYILG